MKGKKGFQQKHAGFLVLCILLLFPHIASMTDKERKIMIRSEPAGKPIAVIKDTTPFDITEESDEWVKVTVTGWVNRSDLDQSSHPQKTYPDQTIPSSLGNFMATGVTFKPSKVGTKCSGVIRNETGKNCKVVTFLLQCYGDDGRHLESVYFTVNGIKKGKKTPFSTELMYTHPDSIFNYSIDFETSF